MPRPKSVRSSADLADEIRRLKQEQERAVLLEDQRRGAVLREALGGPAGNDLRDLLRPLVHRRDAALFGLTSNRAGSATESSSSAP